MQQISGKKQGDIDVINHIFDLGAAVNAYL